MEREIQLPEMTSVDTGLVFCERRSKVVDIPSIQSAGRRWMVFIRFLDGGIHDFGLRVIESKFLL